MKMKFFLMTAISALALSVPAHAAGQSYALKDKDQKQIGTATVAPAHDKGLVLTVEIEKAEPGWHGIHFHAVGRCSGEGFKDAGGHMMEDGETHGPHSTHGPHAGDLPNIWVNKDGTGKAQFINNDLSPSALVDEDGSALVLHEATDDLKSDPAGNAGGRYACAVLAAPK